MDKYEKKNFSLYFISCCWNVHPSEQDLMEYQLTLMHIIICRHYITHTSLQRGRKFLIDAINAFSSYFCFCFFLYFYCFFCFCLSPSTLRLNAAAYSSSFSFCSLFFLLMQSKNHLKQNKRKEVQIKTIRRKAKRSSII